MIVQHLHNSLSDQASLGPDDFPLVDQRLDRKFSLCRFYSATPRATYNAWFTMLERMGVEVLGLHLHGGALPLSQKTFRMLSCGNDSWTPRVATSPIDYDDRVVLRGAITIEKIKETLFSVWAGIVVRHRIEGDYLFCTLGQLQEKWDITVVYNSQRLPCIDIAPYVEALSYLKSGEQKSLTLRVAGKGSVDDWVMARVAGRFVVRRFEEINFGWFLRLLCKLTEGQIPESFSYVEKFLPKFLEGGNMLVRLKNSFKNHLPEEFAEAYFINLAVLLDEHEWIPIALHPAFGSPLGSFSDFKKALFLYRMQKSFLALANRCARMERVDGKWVMMQKMPGLLCSIDFVGDIGKLSGQFCSPDVKFSWPVESWEDLKDLFIGIENFFLRLTLFEQMWDLDREKSKKFLPDLVIAGIPMMESCLDVFKERLRPFSSKLASVLTDLKTGRPLEFAAALADEGIIDLAFQIGRSYGQENDLPILHQILTKIALQESEKAVKYFREVVSIYRNKPDLAAELVVNLMKFQEDLLLDAAQILPEIKPFISQSVLRELFWKKKLLRIRLFQVFEKQLFHSDLSIFQQLAQELSISDLQRAYFLEPNGELFHSTMERIFKEDQVDRWLEMLKNAGARDNYNLLAKGWFDKLQQNGDSAAFSVRDFEGAFFAHSMSAAQVHPKPPAPISVPLPVKSIEEEMREALELSQKMPEKIVPFLRAHLACLSQESCSEILDVIFSLPVLLLEPIVLSLFAKTRGKKENGWARLTQDVKTIPLEDLWAASLRLAKNNHASPQSALFFSELLYRSHKENFSSRKINKWLWRYLAGHDKPIGFSGEDLLMDKFLRLYQNSPIHNVHPRKMTLDVTVDAHIFLLKLLLRGAGHLETKQQQSAQIQAAVGVLSLIHLRINRYAQNTIQKDFDESFFSFEKKWQQPCDRVADGLVGQMCNQPQERSLFMMRLWRVSSLLLLCAFLIYVNRGKKQE